MASMVLLAVFTVCTGNAAPASETESLSVLRQNAPAIAHAIAADPGLREVIGAEKWPQALQRLAEFSKTTNTDYREALRIIGDTIPRAKNPVGTIKLDGDPSEWCNSIPPAGTITKAPIWVREVGAVVRQDRLYLMAGVVDAAQDFAMPDNELRVTIDCQGGQAWDVCLSISLQKGVWTVKQMPYGSDWQDAKPMPSAQGFAGTVAEISIAISDFVLLAEAKPIWTMYMETQGTIVGPKARKRRSKFHKTGDLPVFNESARAGVAAWPYLRTFLCLCADKPLEGFELTAAAIAIMSTPMYLEGDEAVRKKIRVDNAEFLELARSIATWQMQTGTEYRLKNYPLEAQLAWASRIWLGIPHNMRKFMETSREPGKQNNLENYYWSSTSVEALKKLTAVALQAGLADVSLSQCCERIHKWVVTKQVGSFQPKDYEPLEKRATNPAQKNRYQDKQVVAEQLKAEADVAGTYREEPVSEFGIHHTESLLKELETHGRFMGSCGQFTHISLDLMRTLGIAPLTFRVYPSREVLGDHAWPAQYDPAQKFWRSYGAGRGDKHWWFFFFNRPTVFSYATETAQLPMSKTYTGPRPFPLIFCRELQGVQVKTTAQTGIPTQEVREWMLTPGF
jgi:hypothetical protein